MMIERSLSEGEKTTSVKEKLSLLLLRSILQICSFFTTVFFFLFCVGNKMKVSPKQKISSDSLTNDDKSRVTRFLVSVNNKG